MAAALNPDSRNGLPEGTLRNVETPHRRVRKAVIESDPEDEEEMPAAKKKPEVGAIPSGAAAYSMDTDISQLEAPTFTTLDRGPSQKMIELDWDHKVNLNGKKVVNPMIHNCDKCNNPILIYGRMIPCKHVFCYKCAQAERTQCPRCKEKVSRVEQAGLGSIYMCSHGGSVYGSTGCRRTYLSQRDLQAHIHHRHVKQQQQQQPSSKQQQPSAAATVAKALPPPHGIPSVAAINAATAALVADRMKHETSIMNSYQAQPPPAAANYPTATAAAASSSHQQRYTQPPPTSSQQHHHHGLAAAAAAGNSAMIAHQQSNLITVPIVDGGAPTGPCWNPTQASALSQPPPPPPPPQAFTQPPPNYYPPAGSGGRASYTQYQAAGVTNSSNYGSNGQWHSSGGRTSTQTGGYYIRR